MADWSMEPAAAWMPYDLQLANWTMEPTVCAPGYPVEYASTEVFGSCHQTSVPICVGGQQCEYQVPPQYDLIETPKQEVVVDLSHVVASPAPRSSFQRFQDVARDCDTDAKIPNKIHRYPASIQALGLNKRYTTPKVVAIGPYFHYCGNGKLKKAEKMKHVAAYECIRVSGYSPEDFYQGVVEEAYDVRKCYDNDVVAGIGNDDFLHMMFFDACFLVQYMLIVSAREACGEMNESLFRFLDANDNEIFHDIMLLENQIPWVVVEKVMKLRLKPMDVDKFVYILKDCLQDRKRKHREEFHMDPDDYEPAHLLALLRYYIVGRSKTETKTKTAEDLPKKLSLSVSANELAEIGIKVKANEDKHQLVHMGAKTTWPLFGELFLAPLSLDDARASCLVSMAAFELCTTSIFQAAEDEASAVCTYLLLLAMLVAREEDVQKLRTRHILLGGGLSNKEVLQFFTRLHDLRLRSCYVHTMIQIQDYTDEWKILTKPYALYYRNKTTIAKVVSLFVGTLGIIGTYKKIKGP